MMMKNKLKRDQQRRASNIMSRSVSIRVMAVALCALYLTQHYMMMAWLQYYLYENSYQASSMSMSMGTLIPPTGTANGGRHPYIDASFLNRNVNNRNTELHPSSSSKRKRTGTVDATAAPLKNDEHDDDDEEMTPTTKKPASYTTIPSVPLNNSASTIIPETSTNNTLPSPHEHIQVRNFLQRSMGRSFLPLAAVLEKTTTTTTTTTDEPLKNKKPLPLRIHPASSLTTVSYPNHIQSCQDIPNRWPVGHSTDMDGEYGPNVGRLMSMYNIRHEYAQTTCPVDADPFLPWIHDVFVKQEQDNNGENVNGSGHGAVLEFIAHNKRRCRRDPYPYSNDIANLEPQVALMQSVPIQQIDDNNTNSMSSNASSELLLHNLPKDWKETKRSTKEHWYRLVPLEQADFPETRFLCQFFTLRLKQPSGDADDEDARLEKVVVEETWSTYPYNYEHANFQSRRGQVGVAHPMLTRPSRVQDFAAGIHNENVWNAILNFQCPIPPAIQQELSLLSEQEDGVGVVPTFYVDVVPVRTPPRENVMGYAPQLQDIITSTEQQQDASSSFDPLQEWGEAHILPPVSQSGRWANIPICPPKRSSSSSSRSTSRTNKNAVATKASDTAGTSTITTTTSSFKSNNSTTKKSHFMVGCVWASAVFSERGKRDWDTHTMERMLEWLAYHLEIAGFDHMVVYDNTEAHTNLTSLRSVTDIFPPSRVTRIPWKHRVCNNNAYHHMNGGERSSQYAAEASCRVRYGSSTEWMAFFDTDEYLIPSGNWSSIREWLETGVEIGTIAPDTHILSFYETRASLNHRFTEEYVNDEMPQCHSDCTDCHCVQKRPNATYLESFCEPGPFPRDPTTKARMKQIFRPAFVLNHFVHYATVTNLVHTNPKYPRAVGWPYERRAKEFTEAYMLHTKTREPWKTSKWNTENNITCKERPHKCPVGLAFPYYQGFNISNSSSSTLRRDDHGRLLNEFDFPYNCYELEKVQEDLAKRLHAVLDPLKVKWKQTEGGSMMDDHGMLPLHPPNIVTYLA